MHYDAVLHGFYIEWKSIRTLIDKDEVSVPIISKNLSPMKWIESFKNCLLQTFGSRKCPLLYVIRESAAVPPEAEDPLVLLPHSKPFGASGSVLDEIIACYSHTHPLFKSDNNKVYLMLEQATQTTIYASTVKAHSRTKNGRATWLSMISSHAGQHKWERLYKTKSKFLQNTKWNGSQFCLDKFCGMHRDAYVNLEEAQ